MDGEHDQQCRQPDVAGAIADLRRLLLITPPDCKAREYLVEALRKLGAFE